MTKTCPFAEGAATGGGNQGSQSRVSFGTSLTVTRKSVQAISRVVMRADLGALSVAGWGAGHFFLRR